MYFTCAAALCYLRGAQVWRLCDMVYVVLSTDWRSVRFATGMYGEYGIAKLPAARQRKVDQVTG